MEELLIDDKKYLSTKRAAKVTGYAKDYVGQLCREGRVPARLVGRSWYVLETAIREHRFGLTEPGVPSVSIPRRTLTSEVVSSSNVPEKSTLQATWQPPRYFPDSGNDIPRLYPIQGAELNESRPLLLEKSTEEQSVAIPTDNINQAWREWFADRAENIELPRGEEISIDTVNKTLAEHSVPEIEEAMESPVYDSPEEVVPMVRNEKYQHTVYEEPIRSTTGVQEHIGSNSHRTMKSGIPSFVLWVIRLVGFCIAMAAILIVILNSGKMDTYRFVSTHLGMLSGISLLNK